MLSDIDDLLDRISSCGDEYTNGSAREEMHKFRAENMARPHRTEGRNATGAVPHALAGDRPHC